MRTLAAAVSICLLLGVQSVASAAPGDELYARPGQLATAQGTRLNFYCMGRGSPTIVFDSGWGDWAPVWTIVQPEVAKWTRACSYDRAGAGFSDPGPMPRTSVRIAAIANELNVLPGLVRNLTRWQSPSDRILKSRFGPPHSGYWFPTSVR
jgi:pimeloyl-ACP methyl ester carboxylesterase